HRGTTTMPRGIPRNRGNGGRLTKMEGVRRALAGLGGYDASPKDIQDFLKSQFGISMDTAMISNYKSALKGAGKSSMIRKPVGRTAGAMLTCVVNLNGTFSPLGKTSSTKKAVQPVDGFETCPI